MLQCLILESPDQKRQVFADHLDSDGFWIVNSLESKFWIQNLLIENKGPIIHTDRVLRASELWQRLLLMNDPEWQPLAPDIAKFLIEKWMAEILKSHPLKLSQKDCGRAYQTMGQILPLLSHFQGEDVMEQWFSEKEEAKERWADWYEMGQRLWEKLLQLKIIPQEWMKGVLLNQELPMIADTPYLVDLGLDIDDVESELLLNLSRVQDVTVIVPAHEKDKEVYQALLSRCQPQEINMEPAPRQRHYRLMPSMLAEVKEAVAATREWLDQGLRPQDIVIVSPRIENYWPTLYEHLLVEGIPVQKSVTTPLSQLPVFQTWLSKMRTALKKHQKGDGEQILFSDVESPVIEYHSFQGLFSNVYDVSDYARRSVVAESVPTIIEQDEAVDFATFFEWAFSLMSKSTQSSLETIVEELDDIFYLSETLTREKWLEFFENYFARNEKKICEADSEGIHVLPLAAADNVTVQKAIILGLAEDDLTDTHDTALHWTDIESIKINFGFNLPHADRRKVVEQLHWFDKKQWDEVILLVSETNFSGQFQSPSLYWLQGAMAENHSFQLDAVSNTRWDQVKLYDPGSDLNHSEEVATLCEQGIKRDRGELATGPVPFTDLSLSASSLEEYFKCPFKLFARKSLHLAQDPILDLDIDSMSRGRLLHRICELVVSEKKFALQDSEVLELVDRARNDVALEVYSQEIWNFLRPFYAQLTTAFVKKEVQWRNQYPNTETLAVEKFLKTHIRCDDNESFHFHPTEGIPFRGVIDRIDQNDQNQLVLIDYKSSDAGLTQFGSWIKNGKIQLALYAIALIEGALDGTPHNVVGAFYYVLKTLERSKGFAIAEASSDFLPSKKMTRDDLDKLLAETKALVAKIIKSISDGEIDPSPHQGDLKICETCDWNKLCRNPALSQ